MTVVIWTSVSLPLSKENLSLRNKKKLPGQLELMKVWKPTQKAVGATRDPKFSIRCEVHCGFTHNGQLSVTCPAHRGYQHQHLMDLEPVCSDYGYRLGKLLSCNIIQSNLPSIIFYIQNFEIKFKWWSWFSVEMSRIVDEESQNCISSEDLENNNTAIDPPYYGQHFRIIKPRFNVKSKKLISSISES